MRMPVKDREIQTLLERARTQVRVWEIDGIALKFTRLSLNDAVEIDKVLGCNVFAELMASAREGGALPRIWSYEYQRLILWTSLRKSYPEITPEEVGEIAGLFPATTLAEIVTWILTGTVAEAPRPLPPKTREG